MSTAVRKSIYTFEDFCAVIHDGQKADLIQGVMYVASPDNTDAADLFVWLISLIFDFVSSRDLGKVYGSRVAFRLDRWNSPEPDIAFVRKKRLHLVRRGHVAGPPDLAIEIVSPDSVERDYEKKLLQYERAGVAEYWIIDEDLKRVTLLRLDSKGKYREIHPRAGKIHSRVLPGFWLRVDWLWQKTRPPKSEALAKILA